MGRGKRRTTREILHGVSGIAKPGEIVAIMGGSGAGKTTLLNILAGRVPTGKPSGIILQNGKIRERRTWKKKIGYVEQEDLLYENLTVRETLETAALLRLPNSQFSKAQKLQRVSLALEALGLSHIAHSRIGNPSVGGISGGEKKRVSIGIELVADPGLLFLDEPTTGLDAATSQNLIALLKRYAKKTGKTLIMTIHMPRETILDLLDVVGLMAQGKNVWFGPPNEALQLFESQGFHIPMHTNPADFFLDILQVDPKNPETERNVERFIENWPALQSKYVPPIDDKLVSESSEMERFGVPYFYELGILLQRNFKSVMRGRTIIIAHIFQQLLLFLLLGFVFFRIDLDAAGVQNRVGVLFFICINQVFSFLQPIITVFPLERRMILRERAAGMYRVSTAYAAKAISQWPTAAIASACFSIPVYWLIGLNHSFARFLYYFADTQVVVFASQSLGMIIGAAAPNVQMAQVFGPLVVVVFVIFGGNFGNISSVTPILRWIQWLSIVRYAYGGFMINEFKGLTFDCSGGTGAFCKPSGEEVVEAFSLVRSTPLATSRAPLNAFSGNTLEGRVHRCYMRLGIVLSGVCLAYTEKNHPDAHQFILAERV
ncbi:P-loop containing nucleoside triphosphate hydrolase protein [Gaertneriomyces semiglobifer]|nr:P-loop containing nucleoside triphosphate hydrolase protein [Gaertneriomyces semiglobifer]